MKEIKTYIIEKLKLSKSIHTLFPETKDELKRTVADEILKKGE